MLRGKILPTFRTVRSRPGFWLLATFTMALGIGVNVAIFSALDALVLRPFPFPQPDRLMAVYEDDAFVGYPKGTPSVANYLDWRRQSQSFADIGATRFCRAVLTGDGRPEQAACRTFTDNVWPILGVNPIRGRWFSGEEDHPRPDVVVIGEALWTRRYGRDESLVGRAIRINDAPFKVVGIMPAWFRFTERTELWLPMGFTPQQLSERGRHILNCYGRLKPGVSARAAEQELKQIQSRIDKAYPQDTDPRMSVSLEPLQDALVGSTGPELKILMGAAAIVLLIACANVANLLLLRATGRQQELAVRAALGANHADLLGLVLVETLLMSLAAGAIGLMLAFLSKQLLENFIPEGLSGSVAIAIQFRVLAFTLAASFLAAIVAAVGPMVHLRRMPLMDALRQDSRSGGSGPAASRLRGLLVIGEIALTVMLSSGAGLLIKSLYVIWKIDIGFRPAGLMAVSVSLPPQKYADDAKRWAFYDAALEKIRAIPGVTAADFSNTPPFFSFGNSNGFAIEDRTPAGRWEPGDMLTRIDTAGYLETIGATLVAGRHFTIADREGTPDVAIVNQSFANMFFPGQSVIGRRISLTDATTPENPNRRRWRTIVGVVKEIRERGYNWPPKPVTYIVLRQIADWTAGQLVVRSRLDSPLTLLNPIRRAIQEIDPDQPIGQARTFDEILALDQTSRRQQMALLSLFAGLSLVMACLGIYAVLAYMVESRKHEVGIRMALGAGRTDVVRLVATQGLRLTGLGALLGVTGVAFGGRLLESSLYGVRPFDPATVAAVCGIVGLVALCACVVPARQAASTQPTVALKG